MVRMLKGVDSAFGGARRCRKGDRCTEGASASDDIGAARGKGTGGSRMDSSAIVAPNGVNGWECDRKEEGEGTNEGGMGKWGKRGREQASPGTTVTSNEEVEESVNEVGGDVIGGEGVENG